MQHQLTNGHVLLLDEEDAGILAGKKWFAQTPRNTYFYAASTFKINGKYRILYFHRLVMKAEKGQFVDHINGNTLDCRKVNLRLCDNRLNQLNQRKIRGKVPFKGVTHENGKYRARIRVGGKKLNLGSFDTPEQASKAYAEMSEKLLTSRLDSDSLWA